MSQVAICGECGGEGYLGYDRGPAVERCPGCRGAGLLFGKPSTAARDFRDLITGPSGSELAALPKGGALRALAVLAAGLEERCERLELELARRP
ncbi:MAG: hypothetical protein ACRDM1_10765 [Gaiellaceae bacterium]